MTKVVIFVIIALIIELASHAFCACVYDTPASPDPSLIVKCMPDDPIIPSGTFPYLFVGPTSPQPSKPQEPKTGYGSVYRNSNGGTVDDHRKPYDRCPYGPNEYPPCYYRPLLWPYPSQPRRIGSQFPDASHQTPPVHPYWLPSPKNETNQASNRKPYPNYLSLPLSPWASQHQPYSAFYARPISDLPSSSQQNPAFGQDSFPSFGWQWQFVSIIHHRFNIRSQCFHTKTY